TLAFERALRGQDFFGEVLRRVGLGRTEAVLPGGWPTDRLAALETELRSGRKVCTALTAAVREPSPALQAELCLGWILVLAPGALHLTLTSQVGCGRDGGTTLARGLDQGQ